MRLVSVLTANLALLHAGGWDELLFVGVGLAMAWAVITWTGRSRGDTDEDEDEDEDLADTSVTTDRSKPLDPQAASQQAGRTDDE